MIRPSILAVLMLLVFNAMATADWTRFRGPNGSGISRESAALPTKWDATKNLDWKVALPGPGSSCPIVVGDRVYVTCWSGYGMERQGEPGEQANLRRHLICIDAKSGSTVWNKTVEPYLPEDEYGGMFAEHGYASHTPVSDGEHIFAFFGKTGVIAFDLDGNEIWRQSVGTESGARNWGTASSPILYKNLVIVPATAESESIVAMDKSTGEQVWKQEAAMFNSTWGTPVLVQNDDRDELVIAVPGEIWSLAPETGKLLWYCEALGTNSFCSSVVAEDGIVYAMETGMGGGGGVAVRSGGNKDVTDTHVVWSGRQSGRIATPIVVNGRIFAVSNKLLTCYDAKTGDEIFKGRLRSASSPAETETSAESSDDGGRRRRGRGRGGRGGQDYGSPVLADGKIYFTTRGGETFVLRAGDTFEQSAVNRVTNDSEDFSATPAVSDGRIFIRSNKHLYCVGQ